MFPNNLFLCDPWCFVFFLKMKKLMVEASSQWVGFQEKVSAKKLRMEPWNPQCYCETSGGCNFPRLCDLSHNRLQGCGTRCWWEGLGRHCSLHSRGGCHYRISCTLHGFCWSTSGYNRSTCSAGHRSSIGRSHGHGLHRHGHGTWRAIHWHLPPWCSVHHSGCRIGGRGWIDRSGGLHGRLGDDVTGLEAEKKPHQSASATSTTSTTSTHLQSPMYGRNLFVPAIMWYAQKKPKRNPNSHFSSSSRSRSIGHCTWRLNQRWWCFKVWQTDLTNLDFVDPKMQIQL